jgi:hypothetical protein
MTSNNHVQARDAEELQSFSQPGKIPSWHPICSFDSCVLARTEVYRTELILCNAKVLRCELCVSSSW